jgi:hypothetical protein
MQAIMPVGAMPHFIRGTSGKNYGLKSTQSARRALKLGLIAPSWPVAITSTSAQPNVRIESRWRHPANAV